MFHVVMEGFHNRISVMPYVWDVLITNTPRVYLKQLMFL
jgi:hypothetical protein